MALSFSSQLRKWNPSLREFGYTFGYTSFYNREPITFEKPIESMGMYGLLPTMVNVGKYGKSPMDPMGNPSTRAGRLSPNMFWTFVAGPGMELRFNWVKDGTASVSNPNKRSSPVGVLGMFAVRAGGNH